MIWSLVKLLLEAAFANVGCNCWQNQLLLVAIVAGDFCCLWQLLLVTRKTQCEGRPAHFSGL